MSDPADATGQEHKYLLGHSERELDRLNEQARVIDPLTRQFFLAAGVETGMRVLDVGSGAGDVAILAAGIVGNGGEVVGIDRSATALVAAQERVRALEMRNVSFRESEVAEMSFDGPFDAVVGRYVLMFQPDPAAVLRQLARHLRPGGVVVFHEPDWRGAGSHPPVPAYDRACRWLVETLRLSGNEANMGIKLYAAFVDAGLPAPEMRAEAPMSGPEKNTSRFHFVPDLVATVADEIERLGIATAAEIGIDTLYARMESEAAMTNSVTAGRLEVGAWARV